MQYEMAEDDQAFIDRIFSMSEDQIMAYIEGLPKVQQRLMAEAIFRAVSQRAVADYMEALHQGFVD